MCSPLGKPASLAVLLLALLGCRGAAAMPDFELPESARLVSGSAGPSDIHGDQAETWVYELSAADARALSQRQLWWMRADAGKWETSAADPDSPAVTWQRGRVPTSVLEAFGRSGPDGRTRPPELEGRRLVFVDKRVEGGWQRTLIVDVERRRLYYARVTW